MKKLLKYISIAMSFVLLFLVSACTNNNSDPDIDFVGIAIFQNSVENNKWNSIKQDKTLINNIIETKDNKIVYDADPEFLFFIYSQESISSYTKNSDYISNTTRDEVEITENKIKFTIERIAEDTDILIYFIYKIDGEYYLKFVKEAENISSDSKTIILDIDNDHFDKIELNLEINLSTKKEY